LNEALSIVKKIANDRNAPLILVTKHKRIEFKYLNGEYQQENKDIALTAIGILKRHYKIKINKNQILSGIKKTQWPARLQFISKNVLIDCAHNPAGFEVLKNELKIIKNKKKIKGLIFVVGIQTTKDIKAMLKKINSLISKIIFTKSRNEKAAEPKELLRMFNEINKNKAIKIKLINNPKKALNYAKKIEGRNNLVVVTGSIYMVGEIIKS